jgi:hypothetical protein
MATGTPVVQIPSWTAGGGDIPEFPHAESYAKKLWDTNISRNDEMLGRLLAYLREKGILDSL